MSMGFSACHVVTISEEALASLCPSEHAAFAAFLNTQQLDIEDVARYFDHEDELYLNESLESRALDEDAEEAVFTGLHAVYAALRAAFATRTTVDGDGLVLLLGYHSEDDGSRYDDVTGAFWVVEGAYTLSKPGQAFVEHLTNASFVVCG